MKGGMHGEAVFMVRGACMAKGGVVRGCVCQRGVCDRGGVHGRGACITGEMATAAGSTHPTGMHSCKLLLFLSWILSLDDHALKRR